MNARRASKRNPALPARPLPECTWVIAPFERYDALAKAIARIGRTSKKQLPLDILVVEGHSPDYVRTELEHIAKPRKSIRIVYSHRIPTLAEAYNLALPHVRTPYVFFSIPELAVSRSTIEGLLDHAKRHSLDSVSPLIPDIEEGRVSASGWSGRLLPHAAADLRAVLLRKDALKIAGSFDEELDFVLAGIDISAALLSAKRHPVRLSSLLPYAAGQMQRPDAELSHKHWNPGRAERMADHFIHKHGRSLAKEDYVLWVRKGAEHAAKRLKSQASGLQLPVNFAKVLTKRLSHSLSVLRVPTRSF